MSRQRFAVCAVAAIAPAVLFGGCRAEPDSPVPLSIMAPHTAAADEPGLREYRQFDVLDPVVIDTGLTAAAGTFRFEAQFKGEEGAGAAIGVRVAGREIGSCKVNGSETWQECVVALPEDVKAAPVELALQERGRYRLASLELTPAGSSSEAADSAAAGDE